MVEEIQGLQQRLQEAEEQLEVLKNSNSRELNTQVVSGMQSSRVPNNPIHSLYFPLPTIKCSLLYFPPTPTHTQDVLDPKSTATSTDV